MVWGMITSAGVGLIVRFHGNINAIMLILIYAKGQFATPTNLASMKWPPQSPDMNPIENV